MEFATKVIANTDIPVFSTEKLEEATEYVNKFRAESEGRSIIGTHSGVFHCDEVLGCTMLKYTKQFANPAIIRSRNPAIHELTDILIDVGDVFDVETKRFDHHQKTFEGYFHGEKTKENENDERFVTKMSSAGLVYKYFGKEVIRNLAEMWEADLGVTQDKVDQAVEEIYIDLYKDFIKEIDAIDNGVSQFKKGYQPKYHISTGLASRVSRLNPAWNVEDQNPDKPFQKALGVTEDEFLAQIYAKLKIVRPAYNVVLNAFENREEFHESGQVIYLKQVCPWKSHLYKIEEETKNEGLIKFTIFQAPDGMYRVQAVSVSQQAFENRISLHEDWRGKRDEELQKIAGLDSLRFVHHSGFIGGAGTLADAIKMVEISMEAVKHKEGSS
uniref:Uncharacterized protein n=1 Tax=Euplotes harpa TaxID=151035 RepID=A0A7S3N8K1_9SPIT